MEIILKADNIIKDYPLGEVTVHALRGVSFELYAEELVVILGPSGSGKSTTLNILGGIETATAGALYYRLENSRPTGMAPENSRLMESKAPENSKPTESMTTGDSKPMESMATGDSKGMESTASDSTAVGNSRLTGDGNAAGPATKDREAEGLHQLDWSDQTALTRYRREHIGFVFQFYNLLPGLTALENIELAGELGKQPLDARQLLEDVGLSDRAGHFPNRLSGGEQQRIAIARALCKNPDLLLCDEPTGALDSASGKQVLRLIHGFCRRYRKPVVIITHNQDIARIADRVFFFRDGMLSRIEVNPSPGTPDEIEW